jgi:hypothetical protein
MGFNPDGTSREMLEPAAGLTLPSPLWATDPCGRRSTGAAGGVRPVKRQSRYNSLDEH